MLFDPQVVAKTPAQLAAMESPARITMFGGSAGALKALALDTPIPTPSGWTPLADIQVGDTIFDDLGAPCRVVGRSEIFSGEPSYRVIFSDNTEVVCSGDHLWFTLTDKERLQVMRADPGWMRSRRAKRPSRGKGKKLWLGERNSRRAEERRTSEPPVKHFGDVRTTLEIKDTAVVRGHRNNHSVPVARALQLPDADLPIDPYVLGAWLGDGTSASGQLTSDDPFIPEEIGRLGYPTKKLKTKFSWGIEGLNTKLRALGLRNNKHIPAAYLRASPSQRLSLLQGLLDTDGTAPKGRSSAVFYTTKESLRDGVLELARTLGMKPSLSTWTASVNGKYCGPAYGIGITSEHLQLFRLPRKRAGLRTGSRSTNNRRYIVAVDQVASVPTRCLMVDSPSHLFLAGRGFIPTHNTASLLFAAALNMDHPRGSSIIFRKTGPELGEIRKMSQRLYRPYGAEYTGTNFGLWTFPSGGQVAFSSNERDDDIHRYQGREFDFVGFDESTHFSEFVIRYALGQFNRTSEPYLQDKLRIFLATNPGNIGHRFHQLIFLGPTCPHCAPTSQTLQPYKIYTNREWPSDKWPIGFSTVFIPGKLGDHDLLGDDYKNQLESLPAYLRKARRDGCWAGFEGQFFDCWNPATMVIKRQLVGEQWWWNHWIGADYGFGKSLAVAHLLCKTEKSERWPNGQTIVLDEYLAKHQVAEQFALSVNARWARMRPVPDSQERRMMARYLSPDAWNQRGDGHTIAVQMAQEGMLWTKASNDRQGGAMLLYTALEKGELLVCNNCVKTIEMFPSRIHDKDQPDDVQKVVGDELDDVYDAIRYADYSYVSSATKPKEIQVQEAMTSTDPTIAMMQRQIAESRIQEADAPIGYGGSAWRGRTGR